MTFDILTIQKPTFIYTWGNGGNGKLGHEDAENKAIPTKVDKKSNTK